MAYIPTTALTGFIATLLVFLSLLPSTASAADIAYCSSQNTAAGSTTWYEDLQSNGLCSGRCQAAYAFAVINYKNCWCSNYIPQAQDSTSTCDGPCPGYPFEICGSNAKDRFVYIAMGSKKPSGTKGSSDPTSTNPSSAVPSPVSTEDRHRDTQTITRTVTASASAASSTSITTPSSSSSTTFVTSTSASPVTSARLVTISGQIVTETVIVTNPSPSPSLGDTKPQKSSTNVGAIVGGVVGGVVGLAAIVGLVFFLLWRRRRQERDDENDQSGVQRNVSTMSKAGLLRTEKPAQYPPPIATSFNKRNSRNMMQDTDSVSPVSGSDRRNSRPYIFDQRLNPSAIMTFDNTSQGSIVSMDDSRDYGRTLNVRNPDPEPRG